MYNLFMKNHEERVKAEVRKWGHSLGVTLPKDVTKRLKIKEHEIIELKVRKGKGDLMDLFGTLKFKEPTKKIIKELKEGWED